MKTAVCWLSLFPSLCLAWTVAHPASKPPRSPHYPTALAVAAADEDSPTTPSSSSSRRVEEASQSLDELTDAFLGDDLNVDDFLAAIENQVERIEAEPSPRRVRGVVDVAKQGAATLLKGITTVAKETEQLAETLPQTKVGRGEDSVTYGEAFNKVGKGAKGILALASALGGFVKETVEHEIGNAGPKAIAKERVPLLLPDIPNESLTEEEMKYDETLEETLVKQEEEEEVEQEEVEEKEVAPKGINPSLLSNFLQKMRETKPQTLPPPVLAVPMEETEIPEATAAEIECSTPEDGDEPNLLAFFLNMGSKN